MRQHDALLGLLRSLGARVEPVAFVHGAYDSVFAKDSAILVRRGPLREALLTSPRFAERQQEQEARHEALGALAFQVTAGPPVPLEGGDVVLHPRVAFLGHGFRSSKDAAHALARFLRRRVVPLRLRDPRLYHLDMALAVVDAATVLVCEEALAPASRARLRAEVAPAAVVAVTLEEALAFALNVVVVGRDVVKAQHHPRVDAILAARGYRIHVTPLGEFHQAGGSAACLVARVHEPAVPRPTRAALPVAPWPAAESRSAGGLG